jgi:hypothetical protein
MLLVFTVTVAFAASVTILSFDLQEVNTTVIAIIDNKQAANIDTHFITPPEIEFEPPFISFGTRLHRLGSVFCIAVPSAFFVSRVGINAVTAAALPA